MMMSSSGKQLKAGAASVENGVGVQVSTFSELVDDVTLLPKQIFAWIVSAKFGDLYAAAPTRHSNTVGVAFTLGDLVTVVLVFVCFEHRGCWMIFAELLNVQVHCADHCAECFVIMSSRVWVFLQLGAVSIV
ncbi:hypothetical protein QQP08_003355 [Theobroma cacao]|nr:hypothetical protein QQP08_003355 [Theobroma cacao]